MQFLRTNKPHLIFAAKASKFRQLFAKVSVMFVLPGFINIASAAEAKIITGNPLYDLVLQDQNGRVFPLANYKGKTLLVNFIFTTCGATCPLQTRQLVEVRKKIPKEELKTIRFLSVTVDPTHDTPAILKTYAKTMGADTSDWTFATGTEQVVAKLTKQLHIYDPRKTKPQANDHINLLYLYDKNGLLMQRYSGDPVDIPRLAREIQQLDLLVKH